MTSEKKSSFRKEREILGDFENQVKDIRLQLSEQLKCLDSRLDTQEAIVTEIQDFFRKRAEVELEYSRSLEKLAKNLTLRHKAEKQKREHWHLVSLFACWQALIAETRQQSKDHAVLSEIYGNCLVNRCTQIIEDIQRIYKRCREIGAESHAELLKVLNELCTAIKTYHLYHGENKQAESKLRCVEEQRLKVEQSITKEKPSGSKKWKVIDKECVKRQTRYTECKLKALKARNEYLLCMNSANAAIHKYFADDLSDVIDCMDFGFHNCVARAFLMYVSADECLKKSLQQGIDNMNKCISNLDARTDKQRFLEANNPAFMLPKKFEFQSHRGDEVCHVIAQKPVHEELLQRYKQLQHRLTALKTESDEIWKTLETAEKSLMNMINQNDYDCQTFFIEQRKSDSKEPEAVQLKRRADKQETEDFYLNKFREYVLDSNLITRLQAKYDQIHKAIGNDLSGSGISAGTKLPSVPPKPKKKRIGRTPLVGQPKLFGGSLEEYVDATSQEIPLIIQSCIRIINLYGLHHQGVFRVSGSQVEINSFKDAFERGEDPLSDMTDGSDMNSVAGVLKLYLRELREPLFPIYLFDQFMEISKLESKDEFIEKVRDLVITLPRAVFVVMRYLFAFLNHLSEFSDENMMDPYNLAICFGPTLLPIPDFRDQVQYQNLVNELVKNIIVYQEDIFPNDGGIVYEKYIAGENEVTEMQEVSVDNLSEDGSEPGYGQLEDEAEPVEAMALFDFTGRSERELTFRKGDKLFLNVRVSSDWWRGSLDGKEGLIPEKYIQIINRDEVKEKPEKKHLLSDSLARPYAVVKIMDESENYSLSKPLPNSPSVESVKKNQSPSMNSLTSQPPVVPTELDLEETNLSSHELVQDIDSALAAVFSSLESLEVKTTTSHTPDLVMNLPIKPASPSSDSKRTEIKTLLESESSELSTAECFAQSNQCTMKKGRSYSLSYEGSENEPVLKHSVTTELKCSLLSSSIITIESKCLQSPTIDGKSDFKLIENKHPDINPEFKIADIKAEFESKIKLSENKSDSKLETRTSDIKSDKLSSDIKQEHKPFGELKTIDVRQIKPPVKAKPPLMKKPSLSPSPSPETLRKMRETMSTGKPTSC